jgi:hypothetical protein
LQDIDVVGEPILHPPTKNGRQTGADRAALDWALSQKDPCGGRWPKDRKAEDGPIPEGYPLRESTSASYLQRTEWNVRDSDGTVLFSLSPSLSGGSKRTVDFAKKHQKPWLHIHAGQTDCEKRLRSFLADNAISILNVAGPRKSKEPGVAMFVMQTLERAFYRPASNPSNQGCGSRIATLTMVFKSGLKAQKHWRRLNGAELVAKVITGVKFVDGEVQIPQAA